LVIGITEFGWAGSSLVGIPLVGLLIARVGWQSPFLVLGSLSLLAAIAIALLIPAEGRQPVTAGAALNFREAWRLVRSSQAALGLLVYSFLIGLGNDNFFVVYGVWLEEVFALSVVALGLATSVIGAAELVGEGLTAAMADRLGLKRAVFAGLTLSTLSYLLLPLLGQTLPLALSGLFIVFALFEFAVVTTNSLATEVLPGARATMMSAMLAAIGVGRVIGALVGGPVWLAGGLMANCSISAATTGLGLIALLWGLRHWR
jgi:predicted MFS family arabinose efflux permease